MRSSGSVTRALVRFGNGTTEGPSCLLIRPEKEPLEVKTRKRDKAAVLKGLVSVSSLRNVTLGVFLFFSHLYHEIKLLHQEAIYNLEMI